MVQKVWISGLCYRRRNDIEFNLGVGFLGNDVEFNVGVGLGNDIEFNVGVGLGDLLRWGKGSKKRRCTATANVKYVRVSKGKGACVPVPRYWDLGAKHVGATSGKYKGGSVYADHVICVYSSPKKGSTSLTPPDSTPPWSTSHPARSKKEKTQPRRVWCMVPQERAVYYTRSYLLVSLWFTDPGAVAITSQLANPSLSWRHWAAQLPRGRQDPRSGLRSAFMYRGNKKKNGTRPPVRFNGKSGKSPKCSRASLLSHDLSQTTRLVTATSSCRARASSSCATSSIVRSACSRRSSSPSNQTLMGSLALRPVGAHSIWTECH